MGTINLTAKKMSKVLSLTLALCLVALSLAAAEKTASKPATKTAAKTAAKPAAKPAAAKKPVHKLVEPTPQKFDWKIQPKSSHAEAIKMLKVAKVTGLRKKVHVINARFTKTKTWKPTLLAYAKKAVPVKEQKKIEYFARFLWE